MAEYKYNIPASGWVDKQIAKYEKVKCNVTDFSYEAVEGELWDGILIRTDESDTTYGYILLSVRENENESSGRSQDVKVTFKVNGDECSTKLSLCQVNKHEDTPEPPTPVLVMLKLVETGGTTHTAECQTEKVDITNETITAITTDKASIKSVEINGQCVNNISAGTFSGCDSLISVRMSEGVNTVGGFGALTDINPCSNITSIGPVGSGASVEIPNSVKTIGSNAFSWSRGLTGVTIPSNVETISTSAFTATIFLTSCTFQENSNLKTIENYAFAYAKFTTLDIPSSVTKIGIYCFTECRNLETVTLPPNITILNQGTFNHCSGLTSIDIPDAVTAIGDWAFEKCTALTSVTIGTGITQINQSFRSCSSLTSFTIKAVTPPTLDGTAFSDMANCPIYVPSGSVEAYQTADVWSGYASRIKAIP